jgi:hypothetical protein
LEVKVTYVVEFAYMLKGTSLDNQTPV